MQFVMACADLVPALHPFHGSCQPVWLFLAAGEVRNYCNGNWIVDTLLYCARVVGVMHGPNVTKMRAMVVEESDKERAVAAGTGRRQSISISQAVPGKRV